ncbi:MAG: hypothetical protein AAB663_00590 [Patescibacteria group bacterium]
MRLGMVNYPRLAFSSNFCYYSSFAVRQPTDRRQPSQPHGVNVYQLASFITCLVDEHTGIQLCRWMVTKPKEEPDVVERRAIAGCRVDVMHRDIGFFLRVSISSGDVQVVFLALPDRPGYLVQTATFPAGSKGLQGLEVGQVQPHANFCCYIEAAVKLVNQ